MSPEENEMLPDNESSLLCIHHYDSSDNYARLYTQALKRKLKRKLKIIKKLSAS